VYIGFGSMSDRHPRATTQRLLAAVRAAGVRALISRGWAGLGAEDVPEGVRFIDVEPHGQLFPRCAAVVHHGGAGTLHAAARAGVPQVILPQLLDQHYWAERAFRAGVTPGTVARYARGHETLADALRRCVEDAALRARAKDVAGRMVTDGTARAVDALERLAA
jgi:sterol 3beta-glucosyltransferase